MGKLDKANGQGWGAIFVIDEVEARLKKVESLEK